MQTGPSAGRSFVTVLFILITDVLSALLKQARDLGFLESMKSNVTFRGIRGLQFADDILLF